MHENEQNKVLGEFFEALGNDSDFGAFCDNGWWWRKRKKICPGRLLEIETFFYIV